jgi:arylsulfatase A-like enzyme
MNTSTSGSTSTRKGCELPAEHREVAEAALDVLLDAALEPVVDMVLLHRDGVYEARAHDGAVTFRRTDAGGYETVTVDGHDPLADQGSDKFAGVEAERAHKHPVRADNQYPHAYEHVGQLFDSPATPDLCVIHSARHNWEDQGGHLGEHGSLGVVQARAPFVIGGKGVRRNGVAPMSMRLVDVAPTVAALLGCAPLGNGDDARYVAGQDGEARLDVIDERDRPRHVVGFLFDGTNPNVLYDMAARGEAPNVARLIEMGTAFGHGAIASLPTITLANHSTIITGRHPGHHGILNNAWYDRARGTQVITNSNATWPWAMQSIAPGTESIHVAVSRTWDDAFSASINEPCDVGAQYSTFDFFRRGEVPPIPSRADDLPHTSHNFVRPSKDYEWSSVVDHMAVEQAVGIWSGQYRDVTYPAPRFCWVNFTLTDAAMHEGGPHSEMAAASIRDSDGRIGEVIAAVERAGVFDDTAFVLMADHGMEETDRTCRGDWDVALADAGIPVRDEAYGFLYFGVEGDGTRA